ncbi:MAG: hypothetical protein LBN97_02320 [Oscillospiraceae bacterium]|jgi:hypothetical protein|nr:hypothetical protein [Oscillospiraceae bacterium]
MTDEQWDARIRSILNFYDVTEDKTVFRNFVVNMLIDNETRNLYEKYTFQEQLEKHLPKPTQKQKSSEAGR